MGGATVLVSCTSCIVLARLQVQIKWNGRRAGGGNSTGVTHERGELGLRAPSTGRPVNRLS